MIVKLQGAALFERWPTRHRSMAPALVETPEAQILRENR
jgi:hypothetical protein